MTVLEQILNAKDAFERNGIEWQKQGLCITKSGAEKMLSEILEMPVVIVINKS